ncbi:MAG TPA: hypothetical protein VMV21_19655 [Vicinamibacteria bacterium]|nr:hypothetical protein [Vicinamibacteria bacterium]
MAGDSENDDELILRDPVAPAWTSEGPGGDFKVPTVALAADVFCDDGRQFKGRIFLPASASAHAGVMRAEEWMNESNRFFPLLPDGASSPIILNKREVLVVTVPASADRDVVLDELHVRERRVAVECGGLRLEGTILIDMPEANRRVVDYLNRPEAFLTLREGDRHHLVCKPRITRVVEIREE